MRFTLGGSFNTYNRGLSKTKPKSRVPGEAEGAFNMTMDKSLRVRAGMVRSRSVLTRAERIARLQEADRWQEGRSPIGLPKVRVYKLSMKKKKKKKEEEGAEAAGGACARSRCTRWRRETCRWRWGEASRCCQARCCRQAGEEIAPLCTMPWRAGVSLFWALRATVSIAAPRTIVVPVTSELLLNLPTT